MKTKTKILTLIILLNGFLLKAQTWDIQGLWKVVDNVFDGTTNRLDNLSFASSKRLILAGRYHIYGQVRQTG